MGISEGNAPCLASLVYARHTHDLPSAQAPCPCPMLLTQPFVLNAPETATLWQLEHCLVNWRNVIKQRSFDRSHAPVCGRGASRMGYHAGASLPLS